MNNQIIYDMLSDLEISDIYESLKNRPSEIQDFLGRVRLDYNSYDLHLLPESIRLKANKIADAYLNKNDTKYNFQYFTYVEYNNKFGVPRLGPHKDSTSFSATILYQLDSNVEWEIFVDGVPFILKNNSGLLANVRDQDHWRPDKTMHKDDFVKMIFFHYINPDDVRENQVTPEQLHETNKKWSHITGYKDSEKTY
jgi:hypothetical protein